MNCVMNIVKDKQGSSNMYYTKPAAFENSLKKLNVIDVWRKYNKNFKNNLHGEM